MDTMHKRWPDDLGKLLVRLMLGGLMIFHGIHKVRSGIDWLGPQLQANNLPDFLRYGVYVGEILGPVLVIFGFWTRLGAFLIAVNMVFAVYMVHSHDFLKIDEMSGGWKLEIVAWYFFGALAVMLLGAGRISIDGLWRSRSAVAVAEPVDHK